ncbi:hypothetical protein [Microbacterium sp. 1P10AE]|uniref:hypothetical protein n=1 Tax=Microbacterium sp. 1P10AE TaxID=3132286 RepID=UPI0039A367F8
MLALIGAAVSLYFSARAARLSAEANNLTASAYRDDVKVRTEAQARRVWSTLDGVYTITKGLDVYPPDNFRAFGGEVGIEPNVMEGVNWGWKATADQTQIQLTVHNQSDEVVGPIRAYVCDRQTLTLIDRTVIGFDEPLLPGQTAKMCVVHRLEEHRGFWPVIEYRDAAGVWWRRRHYEPIEQLGTNDPRGWTQAAPVTEEDSGAARMP